MYNKSMSADDAAELVKVGVTVAVTGSGGGLVEPDAVFAAIERRFLTGAGPAWLPLVPQLGLGDRNARGGNSFPHDGQVRGWKRGELGKSGVVRGYPYGVASLKKKIQNNKE